MDFYVVLGRAGFDMGKRKHKKARMGASHKISKDEAIKWFQQTYEGVILPGKIAVEIGLIAIYMIVSFRWKTEEIKWWSSQAWQKEINELFLFIVYRFENKKTVSISLKEIKKNRLEDLK